MYPGRIKGELAFVCRHQRVHGRYTQWLETLPERTNSRTAHLNKHKELAHISPKLRKAILGVVVTFAGARCCVFQPFNPLSQVIFPDVAVVACWCAVFPGVFGPDADCPR